MTCFSSQGLTFRQVPPIPISANNGPQVRDLTKKISEVREAASRLPPPYQASCLLRMAVIVATIAIIAVSILALSGKLATFPQQVVHYFQSLNWTPIAIGAAVFTVLTAGAVLVIRKSLQRLDPVTGTLCGAMHGNEHWIAAGYIAENQTILPGYIDKSTLDEDKSGKAFMYAYKNEHDHMSVAIAVLAVSPLHMIGAIVYNILRLFIIPFFILGCMLVEHLTGRALFPNDRPYHLSDIPKEMGCSLWRIAKAPFFCLAFMFAAIYALFDPLNGRKLGACIEREWNEGVTRAEGFWSVRGPQSLFLFEGGRSPSHLGKNGYYLAGCWQPVAVVTYQENKIISTCSLSRAVNPKTGKDYMGFSAEGLVEIQDSYISALENQLL